MMEVGSVYSGSMARALKLEELRVGGVGLLHFASSMLAPSIRARAADVFPGFIFFPVAVDALTKASSKYLCDFGDVRSHTSEEMWPMTRCRLPLAFSL